MSETVISQVPKDSSHILRLMGQNPSIAAAIDDSLDSLHLVKKLERPYCCIYFFASTQTKEKLKLLVKVPVGQVDIAYQSDRNKKSCHDRPRLSGRVEPFTKAAKEYAARRRIQTSFEATPDPRFGVVKVYGMLEPQQALVMQWVEEACLRIQLYRTHRLTSSQRDAHLETVFRNCGSWLRIHHQLPPLKHCHKRNETRDDFLLSTERLVCWLERFSTNRKLVRRVFDHIEKAAVRCLPAEVPTGQLHGDFAPRNIFVGSDCKVSAFNTLGRFVAPIYEDIAKMLIAIHASGPQMLTARMLFSPQRLNLYEDAFLAGYFHDSEIPRTAIRLYRAQSLFESWAAIIYRHQHQCGPKRLAVAARRRIWESGIRSYLQQILESPGIAHLERGEG